MVWHIEKKQQHKSVEEVEPETQTLSHLMGSYWRNYCRKSTIHGVRYLCDSSLHQIERLFWTLLVVVFVVLTCIAYVMLVRRHSEHKLQTVVENSQLPVFEIAFPAVAVCTDNRINWQKFEQAKMKFLPRDADEATVAVFTTFVHRMETLRFGYFSVFSEMEDLNLNALNDVNITELAEFLALKCEDIFYNNSCTWRRNDFPCCEGFILEHTEWGMCLVFNSNLSPESQKLQDNYTSPFYPRHNSKAGQSTGLNFRLSLDAKFSRSNGTVFDTVKIMIKKPQQHTNSAYTITPNTESYIVVRPEITNTDESTRNLLPAERNCLFSDEHDVSAFVNENDKEFRRNNCLIRCHEDYMLKYCNCTLPLFFPTHKNANVCKASDFICLAKNNDILAYDKRKGEDAFFSSAKPGMICDCFVDCRNTEYFSTLTTLPLVDDDLIKEKDIVTFKVDVHYQAEVLVKYRTSLEFTTLDLIGKYFIGSSKI